MKRNTKNFLLSCDRLEKLDKEIEKYSSGYFYNPTKKYSFEDKIKKEQIKNDNYLSLITREEYELYLECGYGLTWEDFKN